jgi:TctA family transporter
MTRSPDLFWGVIVSMYIGNIMLLVLNLPAIGLWVQVLRIPYPFLFPLILLFCLIGSYSLSNNKYDVLIMAIFGVIGYLMKKVRFEGAPLLLGMVLGLMMEDALRQALIMSGGSFMIFIERPISAGFILAAIALLAIPVLRGGKKLLISKLPEAD